MFGTNEMLTIQISRLIIKKGDYWWLSQIITDDELVISIRHKA